MAGTEARVPARVLDRALAVRARTAGAQAGLALIIYLAGAAGLFGSPLLHRTAHECLCGPSTDAGVYVWAFEWWPHALLHGLNPFYTHLLYAPEGINLAHGVPVPGAALLMWPVTAIAGPLEAFNLAMFLSPVLAAFFTYLLCRRIVGRFWPSLVGGWLFGFSSYLLGQLVAHLNLTLVFLLPAIVHLVLRGLSGELSRGRLFALLTAALVLQFSFSVEVFASLTLFGVAALALAYATGDASGRTALRRMLAPLVLAYLATAALMSVYSYYALKAGGEPALSWRSDKFSDDLLAFVVPNYYTALGGLSFTGISGRFTAWAVEGAAYLGIPMLLMMGLGARRAWRRPAVQVMLITLAIVLVCSLGGRLNVAGPTGFPLPWALAHHVPILDLMLPGRFVVYIVLIGAVLSALWLASAGHRPGPWLVAGLSIALLWPAIGRNYWRSKPELPTLFTTSAYRQVIHPGEIALVLPVGIAGQSMLWQAETHLGFTMASGYVTGPEAPNPYKHYAIYPMLTYFTNVPHAVSATATFLREQHISVVVLDLRAASTTPWVHNLEQLGWSPSELGGAVVLRHTGWVPPPTSPFPAPSNPHPAGPATAQRAARALIAVYLNALAARDAPRVCHLLTPQATAALSQSQHPTRAICTRTLSRLLGARSTLRERIQAARVGPADIHGAYGYVEIVPAASATIQYLPLHRARSRWLINGPAVSASR